MNVIERPKYLNELVALRHNDMIKVVTGMRRSGKSFLLFRLFTDYLRSVDVQDNHIIAVDLDSYANRKLRNPDTLYDYVIHHIADDKIHYVLLDEVQLVDSFEDVLNGFLKIDNLDVYVTGSNAKFLSKDIITEFRGRGYEIRIFPLSFSEYMSVYQGSIQAALNEYLLYGGLPQIQMQKTEEQKVRFLQSLFTETYIKDIGEIASIEIRAMVNAGISEDIATGWEVKGSRRAKSQNSKMHCQYSMEWNKFGL